MLLFVISTVITCMESRSKIDNTTRLIPSKRKKIDAHYYSIVWFRL